jgi:hypothetical protein
MADDSNEFELRLARDHGGTSATARQHEYRLQAG